MKFERFSRRSSGILLHPTSLPGAYGIGEIGPQAVRWLDWLAKAGCSLWQVLPLGPTGYGDSPYQCFSAFAGNPYLISLDDLLGDKILLPDDLADKPDFPQEKVDYGWIIPWKLAVLDRAFQRFSAGDFAPLRKEMAQFLEDHRYWLDDFALFMAIKEAHGGAPWTTWETELRDRHPAALDHALQKYAVEIQRQVFHQFIFFRQWGRLRAHAHRLGIQIIGDAPIFVAHDSADVWAHRELFYLDKKGQPTVVAGVPPDYFSTTGQLWGNPLYRWRVHKATGFAWWIERMRAVLELVDIIRLDHFRGFAAYWEVPGKDKTAQRGRWVKAPGKAFLTALQKALGDLPIIAEDLGVITPDVVELRDSFHLPGMKILQFAYGGAVEDVYLPHNHIKHCVAYTGTHDNHTVIGWFESLTDAERQFYRDYQDRDGSNVAADLIRTTWTSVAAFALAPLQDFLNLGNEARMNCPGVAGGNWAWRMPANMLMVNNPVSYALQERVRKLNYLYQRFNQNMR